VVLSPGKTIGLSAVPLVVVALLGNAASAQELTPRAYWPTPNGTNVFVLAYQHTTGDIVTDPSLPLTDVDSDIDYLQLSYQRTFSLRDRTATVQLSLPFSEGETKGVLEEEFRRRETSGMGDARLRLAINLKGAPSMDAAGFKALRDNPETVVGASLLIQAPTGQYESDRIINIGTNRWSMKPAIGVIWPYARPGCSSSRSAPGSSRTTMTSWARHVNKTRYSQRNFTSSSESDLASGRHWMRISMWVVKPASARRRKQTCNAIPGLV